MASSSGSKAEFIVGNKYKLVRKIGSGSFGDIYLAINITNGEVRADRCPGLSFLPSFLRCLAMPRQWVEVAFSQAGLRIRTPGVRCVGKVAGWKEAVSLEVEALEVDFVPGCTFILRSSSL